jgi:nitroreductase
MQGKGSMNDTIALLERRRSAPPAVMSGPGPTAEELETILGLAARVPDHGKLAPWRFIVFEGQARDRAGRVALMIRFEDKPDLDDNGKADELRRFTRAPLVVAVVSRAAPHPKIPEWEQTLSAGAACMNLIVAARALGFTATWLTEWMAYDARFRAAIGLAEHERIAGFLHIGRAGQMEDRARPVLSDLVTVFPG